MVGPNGGATMARALETNTTVTSLDLAWNRLGPEAGAALARALETNTTVTSLNGINGAEDLLARNCALGHLRALLVVALFLGLPAVSQVTRVDLSAAGGPESDLVRAEVDATHRLVDDAGGGRFSVDRDSASVVLAYCEGFSCRPFAAPRT